MLCRDDERFKDILCYLFSFDLSIRSVPYESMIILKKPIIIIPTSTFSMSSSKVQTMRTISYATWERAEINMYIQIPRVISCLLSLHTCVCFNGNQRYCAYKRVIIITKETWFSLAWILLGVDIVPSLQLDDSLLCLPHWQVCRLNIKRGNYCSERLKERSLCERNGCCKDTF